MWKYARVPIYHDLLTISLQRKRNLSIENSKKKKERRKNKTAMLLITLLATTLGPSHGLPTDPLDVAALDKLNKLNMLSGTNYCAFDNGTRTSHLPPEFFGPEPCVFQSEVSRRVGHAVCK